MNRSVVAALLTILGAVAVLAAEETLPFLGVTPTLSALIARVRDTSPQVRAEFDRVAAAQYSVAEVDGFYDTSVSAASGFTDGPMRTPVSILPGLAPSDSWMTELSAHRPLRQGINLNASVARWDAISGGSTDNDSGTVAALAAEKPLLRDRDFATQRLDREGASQGVEVAHAWRLAVWQDTCHAVTRAYVDWLAAHAEFTVSLAASGRVDRLLQETDARVKLNATPAYQLASARMEVAFRQDELYQAQASLLTARIRLEEIVGGPLPKKDLPDPDENELRTWADACAKAGTTAPFALAISDRPEWQAAAAAAAQADTYVRRAREDLKSDLSLFAGVGWRLNNGSSRHTDNDFAWEAGVVWRRPLGYTAERARVSAREAEASAARAGVTATAITATAEYARACALFDSACKRLTSVDLAVEKARASLDAESARFQLGEGRSRLVLDAQKDLSAANRSANAAAALTIRAYTDQVRAAGISFAPLHHNP